MSKALRIATEEMKDMNVMIWHQYASNNNIPPCFHEFMKLLTCLNKDFHCMQEYREFVQCIKKEGFEKK